MRIGNFDTEKKILIVAEIGNNHEGNVEVAKRLIAKAAGCGADAVKFQTIVPELLVRPQEAERFERLQRFQLTYDQFETLKHTADECGVLFLSTPFDLESAEFLERLVPAFKIASGDNNFYPLLQKVAATGKPVIISTGFADIAQLRESVRVIEEAWKDAAHPGELALLHCVASYPVVPEQANLAAIATLRREFPSCTIGYSDHTLGIRAVAASAALGARIIEKHFTVDHNYSNFRDHQLSADPVELKELVRHVREVETLLGTGEKIVQSGEKAIMQISRRSLSAARSLSAGSVIAESDISWLRPGEGLSPGKEQEVLGKKLLRDVQAGEALIPEILA